MLNMNRPQPQIPPDMSPFGDWFSEVFRLYGARWQVYVLQGLVMTIVIGALPAIGYVGMIASVVSMSATSGGSSADPTPMFVGMGLMYGGIFLGSLLASFLMPGMVYTAIRHMRGEEVSTGDLFAAMRYGWGYLLIGVVMSIASALTCGIAGLLGIGIMTMALPLMIDQDMPTFQALGQAWEIYKRNFGLYFLFPLVAGVLAGAGYMVCGIGVIATLAFMPIAMAVAYVRTYYGAPDAQGSYPGTGTPPSYMPPPYAGGVPAPPMPCAQCGTPLAPGVTVCPQCGRARTP